MTRAKQLSYRRRYRNIQELVMVISMAKGQNTQPEANALIFTTNEGGKSWHGRWAKTKRQRKCLLDGCNDWEVSADLREWDMIDSSFTHKILYGRANISLREQDGRGSHLQ